MTRGLEAAAWDLGGGKMIEGRGTGLDCWEETAVVTLRDPI